jgi:hypothetical protein
VEVIRHFVTTSRDDAYAGSEAFLNGDCQYRPPGPPTWDDLDLRVFAREGRGVWVEVGVVQEQRIKEAVFEESFGRPSERWPNATGSLVGAPLNVRGFPGFDDACVSLIVATHVWSEPRRVYGMIVETWVGYGAMNALKHKIRQDSIRGLVGKLFYTGSRKP